jgi:Secretion system C-terminal sorting domain
MKNFLIMLFLSLLTAKSYTQAVFWELSSEPGDQVSSAGTNNSANFTNSGLLRGTGVTATTGAGSMNSSGWFSGSTPTTLADAIAGNDYYEFTINSINCLFFNPTTIQIVLRSSATGPNTATLRCSSDGFIANISTVTVTTTSTEFTFSETVSPNSQSVIYRLYGYGTAAGGGTPSIGGTMRVGTSVVAGDNDLKFFATTTFVTVTQVANITVTDGDAVPATVLTANVPGAVVNWSRTPENFGLVPTNGTGNVPAFTAFNASGVPITSTFTVNATANNCTGPDMIFTMTVNPAPCTITVDFFGNPSACNDNGTPNDPTDDFFTQNIHASFFNRPLTGLLQIVPGGDQIGTYSIPVDQIIGNAHLFIGVQLKADGTPSVVQMNFTDDPACIDADTGPTVQPCSSGGASCEIIGFSFANIGSCNNNGTPNDDTDDFFLVDIDVLYSNTHSNANLRSAGGDIINTVSAPALIGTNLTHTFTSVKVRADGQITTIPFNIRDVNPPNAEFCSLIGTGPAVNSCSNGGGACAITNLELVNPEPCDDNGTPNDPTDDFYVADLLVYFENPPATGFLLVSGPDLYTGDFQVTIANVLSIGSPYPFSNKKFRADGEPTSFLVEFTDAAGCVASLSTSTGVGPCSFPAPVLTCPTAVTVSCMNEVPAPDPASVFVAHECPGSVTVIHIGDVTSNVTCINILTITRTYQATDECGQSATCSQIITVKDLTPPIVTCPAPITVSCVSAVPVVDVSTLGVVDNCAGTAGISRTFLGEVISNQTCVNRFTITRTYQGGDACGNTATCTQIITVLDNTPPSITCPANVTVSCASLVPPVNIPGIITSDNCSGGAPTVTFVSDVITNQTCANRYTLTRTYRSTDICGNSATCAQIITVLDNTPPSLTCPAPVTVQCANLVPPVNIAGVITSDNCSGGAPTVTFVSDVITNQTCTNRYTLTRTYRSTDICGNASTCAQIITVFDNIPPVITFTDPLIEGVLNGGRVDVQCFGQDPEWDIPTLDESSVAVTDNCTGTGTVTFSQILVDEGDCAVDGYINLYRLTWTASDACGNSSTKFVFLALVDTISPVIQNVPDDILVNCNEIPEPPMNVFASDECLFASIVLFEESEPNPGCQDGQVISRSWTARDACGNETVEVQHITLIDAEGPEILIQLPELAGAVDGSILNYTCNEGGIPEFYNFLSAESVYSPPSCGSSAILSFDKNTIESINCKLAGYLEQRTYHWKAVDNCGNETNLTIAARLIDTEAPVLIGVPDIACINDKVLNDVEATDNCDHASIRFWDVKIPNPCGSGMAWRRTYEAFDHCGNMSRDTAILIQNDLSHPVITFINPVLIDLPPGGVVMIDCAANGGQYTPFGVDDVYVEEGCQGEVNVTFRERVLETPDCSNGIVATISLEWTATDLCGNSTVRIVGATVTDHDSPVFMNFKSELTIGCNDALPEIFATDNCGSVSISIEESIVAGPCDDEYDVERLITAADPCGNTTTQMQTIHVGDGSGPIIEGVLEELCDDLSIPEVSAFDICSGKFVEVSMIEKELETPCRDGRVIERIWMAVDFCGNVSEIHQTIVVNDQTPPEILIPTYSIINRFLNSNNNLIFLSQEDLVRQLDALNEYSVFIEDECDQAIIPVFTLEINYADDCMDVGYRERRVYTWVATDICGNSTSISFSVDIMDDIPPVLAEIPGDITVICEPLPSSPLVYADDPAQPVTIHFSESIIPDSGPGVYVVTRQWIATDACGNSSVAVQHIKWIPDTFLECDILTPLSVECNSHGIIISSAYSGGLGEITYDWEVIGAGYIQAGQGTDEIMIYVGWSEVTVNLNIGDVYGCTSSSSALIECFELGISPFASMPLIINPETDQNLHAVTLTSITEPIPVAFLKKVNLWPNPANQSLNLSFESSAEEEIEFKFFNFLGQNLLSGKINSHKGSNTHQIDISLIPEGGYLLQLQSGKDIFSTGIVFIQND